MGQIDDSEIFQTPRPHVWALMAQIPAIVMNGIDGLPIVSYDDQDVADAITHGTVWCINCAGRLHDAWGNDCPGEVEDEEEIDAEEPSRDQSNS